MHFKKTTLDSKIQTIPLTINSTLCTINDMLKELGGIGKASYKSQNIGLLLNTEFIDFGDNQIQYDSSRVYYDYLTQENSIKENLPMFPWGNFKAYNFDCKNITVIGKVNPKKVGFQIRSFLKKKILFVPLSHYDVLPFYEGLVESNEK
jgi:hypothetical protein